jgi:putative heme-binding domain-containing protein
MCAHAHGSTGLCGIIYLDGGVWGPEWDDHMFVGNCVTSRVNHDHVTFKGATPTANEAPDFLTSDDPWFRPVDLQLGPDSALYVADFYNRIIGHYEVPLDHPGRDKDHSRIWRVVREGYTGNLTKCDLSKDDAQGLMPELASPNLTRRYLATEQLVSRVGRPALRTARELLSGKPEPDDAPLVGSYEAPMGRYQVGMAESHALWVASRLGDESIAYRVGRGMIGGVLLGDRERLCVTSINIVAEKAKFDYEDEETLCDAEFDGRGVFSMRAGGLAMARHAAHVTSPGCLFQAFVSAESGPSKDPQPFRGIDLTTPICKSGDATLISVWKIAMRAVLSQPGHFKMLDVAVEDKPRRDEVADVVATVPTPEAAAWLLDYVVKAGPAAHDLSTKLSHIARYLPGERTAELVSLAQKDFGDSLDTQLDLLAAIREGRSSKSSPTFRRRDSSPSPAGLASATDSNSESRATDPLAAWSAELIDRLLIALKSEPADTWRPVTPPTDANPNPWHPTTRKCAGGKELTFLDSHVAPGSEKFTGTLRSAPFALPAKLTFWLAGHSGFPTAEPHDKNFVRLVDAETGEELARAYPPRHDVAQQITWTFSQSEHGTRAHQHTFLELTDGDNATTYAWLAAGGFDPAVVTIPSDALQHDKRIRMLAQLCSTGSLPVGGTGSLPETPESNHEQPARDPHRLPPDATAYLLSLPDKDSLTPDTRAALADFLAAQSSDPAAALLAPLARDAELAPVVFAALQDPKTTSTELGNAFHTRPFRTQAKLAAALAGSVDGANQLLKLAAPSVLAEPLVSSKLTALDDAKIAQRLKALTASLPPQNEALNKLLTQRLKSYDVAKADVTRGEQVFTTVCFVCHRIGVRGNLVGPQLDGIGARGIERLLEDILDPNRSVDPAFRLHLVKRKDGTLYAGLQRREEGDALVFADATAQETRIPKPDIASNEESAFSLMPPGLGEVLTEQQLDDLLAYLLARK